MHNVGEEAVPDESDFEGDGVEGTGAGSLALLGVLAKQSGEDSSRGMPKRAGPGWISPHSRVCARCARGSEVGAERERKVGEYMPSR